MWIPRFTLMSLCLNVISRDYLLFRFYQEMLTADVYQELRVLGPILNTL